MKTLIYSTIAIVLFMLQACGSDQYTGIKYSETIADTTGNSLSLNVTTDNPMAKDSVLYVSAILKKDYLWNEKMVIRYHTNNKIYAIATHLPDCSTCEQNEFDGKIWRYDRVNQ